MACPYVIEVESGLPNPATLLEIKSRISGLTWLVIEKFDNHGEVLNPNKKWSEDYKTASFCNTTKHDFQLKFLNNLGNIKIKKRNGIKFKNGSKVKFTLG